MTTEEGEIVTVLGYYNMEVALIPEGRTCLGRLPVDKYQGLEGDELLSCPKFTLNLVIKSEIQGSER